MSFSSSLSSRPRSRSAIQHIRKARRKLGLWIWLGRRSGDHGSTSIEYTSPRYAPMREDIVGS